MTPAADAKLTLTDEPRGASDAPALETPSQQIVRSALQPETIAYTKDDGEPGTLDVRRPNALAEFRIVEAVGPATAANSTYMQMINPLIYLGAMDGQPEPMPSTKAEVEALLLRLGHAGLEALSMWHFQKVIAPMMQAMEDAEKAARDKAALKN